MDLPQKFIARMKERLGRDFPAFLCAYGTSPLKGLRVNTLKICREEFERISPFPLEPVPWEENGFYLFGEKAGGDVYHFAGLYYLQEPSAMCAVPLLQVKSGERVLDLCAAPGGKTTQIAAQMRGEGVLVANEIDFSRAKILAQNVERLGVRNCLVTCRDPVRLAEELPEYFDKILVDAPCSGEGMFKKEPNAIPEWSEENVKRCAERQSAILDCAAKMLCGGGSMVYSTCTFAEEEDEWQVERFLARHSEFELAEMKKIFPHEARGEGHFAAVLLKREGERRNAKILPVARSRECEAFFADFSGEKRELFVREYPLGRGGKSRFFLPPENAPSIPALRYGVDFGEWDGKVFLPAHALAMAYGVEAKRKIALDRGEAVKFLRGETLGTDLENGWAVVCVGEYPLGLGKAVGSVVKNHLPKGLRLRSVI